MKNRFIIITCGVLLVTTTRLHAAIDVAPNEAAWTKAVDLLPLIDTERDAFRGHWRIENGQLLSDKGSHSRLSIHYNVPNEYDYRIVFVRTDGTEDVTQILTKSGHQFFWAMGAYKNTVFGFGKIDGKDCHKNETTNWQTSCLDNKSGAVREGTLDEE